METQIHPLLSHPIPHLAGTPHQGLSWGLESQIWGRGYGSSATSLPEEGGRAEEEMV